MGWEMRGSKMIYYRKVREGARVRSIYCGGGERGERAAAEGAERRLSPAVAHAPVAEIRDVKKEAPPVADLRNEKKAVTEIRTEKIALQPAPQMQARGGPITAAEIVESAVLQVDELLKPWRRVTAEGCLKVAALVPLVLTLAKISAARSGFAHKVPQKGDFLCKLRLTLRTL